MSSIIRMLILVFETLMSEIVMALEFFRHKRNLTQINSYVQSKEGKNCELVGTVLLTEDSITSKLVI